MPNDPFAAIAKPIDPFASIAKPMKAAPNMAMTPADLGITMPIPMSQAIPPALRTAPRPLIAPPTKEGIGTGLMKGVGEGLIQTGTAFSPLINKIPYIGEKLAPSAGIAGAKELARPVNTSQAVGKTAEQVSEWLLPTGLEEKAGVLGAKAAAELAPHAPAIIPKIAPTVARMGEQAIESGIRNKMQGGDFSTGALAGAGGVSAQELIMKPAATALANVAMAPGKRLLKSLPEGVNIGRTVMQESTGIRPATITRQLGGEVTADDANLSALLQNAKTQGTQIPLIPGRQLVADEMRSAVAKNAPEYIRDVGTVGDQLKYQYGEDAKPLMATIAPPTRPGAGFIPTVRVPTGASSAPVILPPTVDPVRARAIRQGIDLTIGNWNPEAQAAIDPLRKRVYGSITGGIHSAVPGSEALDTRLSNLIPARDAAKNVSYNPNITQAILNRIGRPTGALMGAVGGGLLGYKEGGLPEAIRYGTVGLVGPELIASPTGQMLAARTLASPITRRVLIGTGLQFNRPSLTRNNNEKP
jgi:hypothetical protein